MVPISIKPSSYIALVTAVFSLAVPISGKVPSAPGANEIVHSFFTDKFGMCVPPRLSAFVRAETSGLAMLRCQRRYTCSSSDAEPENARARQTCWCSILSTTQILYQNCSPKMCFPFVSRPPTLGFMLPAQSTRAFPRE